MTLILSVIGGDGGRLGVKLDDLFGIVIGIMDIEQGLWKDWLGVEWFE